MVRAEILNPTGAVIDLCTGADEEGYCPRQAEDGTLPCAGLTLDATAPEAHWHLRLDVPAHAQKCPVRGFAFASSHVGDRA